MSTTQLQPVEIVLPEVVEPLLGSIVGADVPDDLAIPEDADVSRMLRRGALIGIPAMYLILVVVALVAVPGQPALLLAMIWPALVGGWYFGAIVELSRYELRHQQPRAAQPWWARLGHVIGHHRPRIAG
jgi:hypothetical protein